MLFVEIWEYEYELNFRIHRSAKVQLVSQYSNIIIRVSGKYAKLNDMISSFAFSSSLIFNRKKEKSCFCIKNGALPNL